jgi:hypothetical protein
MVKNNTDGSIVPKCGVLVSHKCPVWLEAVMVYQSTVQGRLIKENSTRHVEASHLVYVSRVGGVDLPQRIEYVCCTILFSLTAVM